MKIRKALESILVIIITACAVTWLIHTQYPAMPHPWHPYIPWAGCVSFAVYAALYLEWVSVP